MDHFDIYNHHNWLVICLDNWLVICLNHCGDKSGQQEIDFAAVVENKIDVVKSTGLKPRRSRVAWKNAAGSDKLLVT